MVSKEQGAMEDRVRGTVERAISSLMVLGMSHDGAASLLMVQSAIRIDDATHVMEVLTSIASLIEDDDDSDVDCGVGRVG
jgi:hypothetical protein